MKNVKVEWGNDNVMIWNFLLFDAE
jgi:hypothetical protein